MSSFFKGGDSTDSIVEETLVESFVDDFTPKSSFTREYRDKLRKGELEKLQPKSFRKYKKREMEGEIQTSGNSQANSQTDSFVDVEELLEPPRSAFDRFIHSDRSFFIFAEANPFRAALKKLTHSKRFEKVVLAAIFLNCLILALGDPLEPDSKWNQQLDFVGNILLVGFTLEMLMSMIADGVVFTGMEGKMVYCSSWWNMLDLLVVVTGWMEFIPGMVGVSAMRAFRALRPLRTVQSMPGLRVLVVTLLASVPLLLDVLKLMVGLFLTFGIIALMLWSGKMNRHCCADLIGDDSGSCLLPPGEADRSCGSSGRACDAYSTCRDIGTAPGLGYANFDNFGTSSLILLQILTLSSWDEVMFQVVEAAGSGAAELYFLLALLLGAYFSIQLLIAVISAKFSQVHSIDKMMLKSKDLATTGWLYWLANHELVKWVNKEDQQEEERVELTWLEKKRAVITELVIHKRFSDFVLFIILLNVLVRSVVHHGQPDVMTDLIEVANHVFTAIFLVEMVLKIIGLGWREYWADGFNKFDTFVNILSIIDLFEVGSNLSALRALRVIRVLRSIKLLNQFPSLKRLTSTMVKAFAAVRDFMLLLLLFSFVFSVLGMQLFGGNEQLSETRRTFDSLGYGMLTIFELLTTNDWHTTMRMYMVANSSAASFYFVMWILLGNFILLSLFLAIFIDKVKLKDGGGGAQSMTISEVTKKEEDDRKAQLVALIRGFPLFKNAMEEVLQLITKKMVQVTLMNVGDVLVLQGNPYNSVFFVMQGRVKEEGSGREIWCKGFFGEGSMQVYGRKPVKWAHTWSAVEPETKLVRLDVPQFNTLLRDYPSGFINVPELTEKCKKIQATNMKVFSAEVYQLTKWLCSINMKFEHNPYVIGQLRYMERRAAEEEKEEREEREAKKKRPSFVADGSTPIMEHGKAIAIEQLLDEDEPPVEGACESGVSEDHLEAEYEGGPKTFKERINRARRKSWLTRVQAAKLALVNHETLKKNSLTKDTEVLKIARGEIQRFESKKSLRGNSPNGTNPSDSAQDEFLQPGQPMGTPPHPISVSVTEKNGAANDILSQMVVRDVTEDNRESPVTPKTQGGGISNFIKGNGPNKIKKDMSDMSVVTMDDVDSTPPPTMKNPTVGVQQASKGGWGAKAGALMKTTADTGVEDTASKGASRGGNKPGLSIGDVVKQAMRVAVFVTYRDKETGEKKSAVEAVWSDEKEDLREKARFKFKRLNFAERKSVLEDGLDKEVYDKLRVKEEGKVKTDHVERMLTRQLEKQKRLEELEKLGVIRDLGGAENHDSLKLFSRSHPVRVACYRVTSSKHFESVILMCILVSSILLALDEPGLDEDSTLASTLDLLNKIFTVVFLVELMLKVVTLGFVAHEGAYLRSGWNVMDFVVVVSSLPSLFASESLSMMSTFRMLRVLRPLRTISRVKSLQVIVVALLKSVTTVGNVFIFGVLVSFLFSILGLQLFMGMMYYCNDSTVSTRDECVGLYHGPGYLQEGYPAPDGILIQRVWINPAWNFDSLPNAMMSLFMVSTLSDWHKILWSAMDVVGIDQQPEQNYSARMANFFMIYIVVGTFAWVSLLVSVIIDFYQQAEAEVGDGFLFVTEEQMLWRDAFKFKQLGLDENTVVKFNLPVDKKLLRVKVRDVVCSINFDYGIMTVIVLNILAMTTLHADQTEGWEQVQLWANNMASIIFFLEACFKIYALYPVCYFSDNWNRFDFFLVTVSIIDFFAGANIEWANILRILRMGRIFKVVKSAKGLRALFNTLITSFPAVLNVSCLMFLVLFMFSVLAMNLFGTIDEGRVYDAYINERYNYRSFGKSVMTLVTVLTGSSITSQIAGTYEQCDPVVLCREDEFNWTNNTEPTDRQVLVYPLCSEVDPDILASGERANCETSLVAFPFFSIFYCLTSYLILTIVMAVMLENFVEQGFNEGLLSQTQSLLDTVRRKLLLENFMAKLRHKIQVLKVTEKVAKKGPFSESFTNRDNESSPVAPPVKSTYF